jgi:hypothetical protein|tara:strand:+ start:1885 stop:2196 length:312 start_codon:yes stop_codon:yes gene_type:complete
MNDFLKEINFYYENYNIYRTIIIIYELLDINLFKSFLDDNNNSSYIINDKIDISYIDERIILIKSDNINIQSILNQTNEYNLLLFYNIDFNKMNYIQNFFLVN